MTMSSIGLLILGTAGMWVLGGVVLRVAGALITLVGVLGLLVGGGADGLVLVAIGSATWLQGRRWRA